MKHTLRFLAILMTFVALFALASCGDDTQESKSETSSASESVDDGTYTVRFYYGVKSYDAASKKVTEYETVKEVKTTGEAVTAPKSADVKSRGYKNTAWDNMDWKQTITSNLDVHMEYVALTAYTVTFKNAIGNTIVSYTMYEGEKISDDQIPATDGYLVYTEEQYNAMADKTGFVAVTGAEGYYMKAADADKTASAIAIPYGNYYKGWTSSNGKKFADAIKADVTYTADVPAATAVIPLVAKGSVTIDGKIDESCYAVIAENIKHPLSFGKGEGSASTTKIAGISDVLNKYDSQEEADAAGKGAAYAEQKANYERIENLTATLYACWDGDFIYYCVKVNDPSVNTNGETYANLRNPYETDSVEIWYLLDGEYLELYMDAAGYAITSHPDRKVYIDYIKANHLFGATVYADMNDLDNPTVIDSSVTTPRALVSGENSGYIVECANPARGLPEKRISSTNPLNLTFDGENWGAPLTVGTAIPMAFQINSISAPATEDVISAVIAGQNAHTYQVLGDTTIYHDYIYSIAEYLNRDGAIEADTNLYNAMKRWNAGWQVANDDVYEKTSDVNYVVVLG